MPDYLCIDPGFVNLQACRVNFDDGTGACSIVWEHNYDVSGFSSSSMPDLDKLNRALTDIATRHGDSTIGLVEMQITPVLCTISGYCGRALADMPGGCGFSNMGAIKRRLGIASGNYYRNKKRAKEVAERILGSPVLTDHIADCILMANHSREGSTSGK